MALNLQQGHTYFRITSSSPKQLDLPQGFQYVGKVGELDDEHVFEVTVDGQPVDPAGSVWATNGPNVMKQLEGSGLKTELLVHKQRAKRDEF